MSRKVRWWTAFLLLGLICSFLTGCELTRDAYFAYVDRVEPAIPRLDAQGTRGIGGEISILNDTGMDVYLYEDGQEALKITSTASFVKDEQGNWVLHRRGNTASYAPSLIRYFGPPRGSYDGQVMKTWEIKGRAGDTLFTIYGRTVYEPARWGD